MIISIIVTSSTMLHEVVVISKPLPTQEAWITFQLPTKASLQRINLIKLLVKWLILHNKKKIKCLATIL